MMVVMAEEIHMTAGATGLGTLLEIQGPRTGAHWMSRRRGGGLTHPMLPSSDNATVGAFLSWANGQRRHIKSPSCVEAFFLLATDRQSSYLVELLNSAGRLAPSGLFRGLIMEVWMCLPLIVSHTPLARPKMPTEDFAGLGYIDIIAQDQHLHARHGQLCGSVLLLQNIVGLVLSGLALSCLVPK
jgi:hypothetical protein